MADSVDTRRVHTNEDAIESEIQDWLDNTVRTSLDEIKLAEEGHDYTIITFIYTA